MNTERLFLIFLAVLLLTVVVTGVLALIRVLTRSPHRAAHIRNILLLCAIGLALRTWGAPMEHRVYNDEFQYISTAQNIFFHGNPESTLKGSLYAVESSISLNRPPAYSLIVSVVYALCGFSPWAPFGLNLLLGILSVLLVYAIAWVLFEKVMWAWWAALFLALSPTHILASTCASADSSGLFFFLLAIWGLSEWSRRRERVVPSSEPGTRIFLYMAVVAASYDVYVKPEYVLVIVGWWLVLMNFNAAFTADRKRRRIVKLTTVLVLLVFPFLMLLPHMIKGELFSAEGKFMSWSCLPGHLVDNVLYLFDVGSANIVTTLAAVAAAWIGWRQANVPAIKALLVLFAAGLLLMSGYFADNSTEDIFNRHLLLHILPYVLLAGAGIGMVLDLLPRGSIMFTLVLFVFSTAATVLALNNSVQYADIYAGVRNADWKRQSLRRVWLTYRADRESFRLIEAAVPEDTYVIYHWPEYVTSRTTRKALSWKLFQGGDRPERIAILQGLSCSNEDQLRSPVSVQALFHYRCRVAVRRVLADKERPFEIDLCDKNP